MYYSIKGRYITRFTWFFFQNSLLQISQTLPALAFYTVARRMLQASTLEAHFICDHLRPFWLFSSYRQQRNVTGWYMYILEKTWHPYDIHIQNSVEVTISKWTTDKILLHCSIPITRILAENGSNICAGFFLLGLHMLMLFSIMYLRCLWLLKKLLRVELFLDLLNL